MVFGFRKRGTGPAVTEGEVSEPQLDSEGKAIPTATGHSTGVDSDEINISEGTDQLKKFKATHQWDYNLDYDAIEGVNKAVESGDAEKGAVLEQTLLEENSPYFEVRAAVRNYDE